MTKKGEDIYLAVKKLQFLSGQCIPEAHFVFIIPPRPISEVLNQVEPGVWDESDCKYDEFKTLVLEDENLISIDMSRELEFEKKDGLHMDAENHKIFGEIVAKKVKEILG